MKFKKPFIYATVTFALIFSAVLFISRQEDERYRDNCRSEVLYKLSAVRARLEAALNSRLILPKSMIAYVADNPDITVEQFQSIAGGLISQYEGIRSIQLAKNSVVSHVYPVEGNEKAIGFKLMENPQQRDAVKRAIDTKNTVVAGPVKLIQGGEGFIGRTPIFLASSGGQPEGGSYWGLSTIIINTEWLFDNGGLNDKDIKLSFALTGKDGLGSHGDIFFGDKSVLHRKPVISDISIPNGSWRLAAIPMDGWEERSPLTIYILLGGSTISFFAAWLMWSMVYTGEALQKERVSLEKRVEERTSELAALNQAMNEEIAHHKDTGKELLKTKGRLQHLISAGPAVIYSCRPSGDFGATFISGNLKTQLGYEPAEFLEDSSFWSRHIHPEDAPLIFANLPKLFQEGKHVHEYRFLNKKNEYRWMRDELLLVKDADGNPLEIVGYWTDITDHKRMTTELIRLDKMDAVGLLAGGIAHDFNNILTAVLNTISLARLTRDPDKCRSLLLNAEMACKRASAITHQLLTFSKGGKPVKKAVAIDDVIMESVNFALSGSNIKSEVLVPEDLWPVEVDPGQISQVLNNLIINACQAMPDGGTLSVIAENKVLDDDNILLFGRYVMIRVRDTGTGMPTEHLNKIFDPYFTTKENGNGLGLATCYSIIKNHGGHIRAESKIREGTTFYIYLPASEKEKPENRDMVHGAVPGTGRVLLMDDEDVLRDSTAELIMALGYNVEAAKNGEEAIELYRKAKTKGQGFDAVILDLTIPGGMGGRDAIQKLIEIDPDVKGIVSSGYSEGSIMADYRKYGFSAVLTKPYTTEQLSMTLQTFVQT